jgi:hypothetical protein
MRRSALRRAALTGGGAALARRVGRGCTACAHARPQTRGSCRRAHCRRRPAALSTAVAGAGRRRSGRPPPLPCACAQPQRARARAIAAYTDAAQLRQEALQLARDVLGRRALVILARPVRRVWTPYPTALGPSAGRADQGSIRPASLRQGLTAVRARAQRPRQRRPVAQPAARAAQGARRQQRQARRLDQRRRRDAPRAHPEPAARGRQAALRQQARELCAGGRGPGGARARLATGARPAAEARRLARGAVARPRAP